MPSLAAPVLVLVSCCPVQAVHGVPSPSGLGCGFAGLTVFASNIDDPYISLEGAESSDEEEDFRVYPTDNLVCVGKADQDYSSVEVHGMPPLHRVCSHGWSNPAPPCPAPSLSVQ